MSDIYIRPITAEDTDLIVKWRNNPRVRNNFIYQKEFDRRTHENWLENTVKTGSAVQFIIVENGTGRPVGSVYFSHVDRTADTAEYGIFIGEDDAVGRGYGSQAAKMAIKYAFNEMMMQEIYLRVFTDNISAIKSYESAGFRKSELLKGVECTSGVKKDMYIMRLKGRAV